MSAALRHRGNAVPRRGRESVDAFLTRELHGIAYEQRERLSEAIPGFAEAVDWPFAEEAPPA